MRDDPYRRAAARPVETAPRGVVVRRADEPDELEAAEERRRQEALAERSLRAREEHDDALRALDLGVRRAGLWMLVLGILNGVAMLVLRAAGERLPSLIALTPALVLAGAWLMVIGAQKAITLESIPSWVMTGATIAFALGLAWGVW